ncbi:MAG: hypothetical protein WC444_06775 [Candidatus Paceibacterota bacterium]
MYLTKETALFQRNDKEQLLPVDVPLLMLERFAYVDKTLPPTEEYPEGKKIKEKVLVSSAPYVKMIPAPRGKWLELIGLPAKEQDKIILDEHLVEPKISFEKDYAAMKPGTMSAISTALTAVSLDVEQKPSVEQDKVKLTEAEEWLLKKKPLMENNKQSCSSTSTGTTSST